MAKKRSKKKKRKTIQTKTASNQKSKKKLVGFIISLFVGVAVLIGYYVDIEQFITKLINRKGANRGRC